IQEGHEGNERTTTTQKTLNGQPDGEPIITKEITDQKVDKIIEVGTGKVGHTEDVKERELPYNTITRVNPNLPSGTQRT
ncbi:G5 domain-containing protein, partial [Lactiplantibacillus plantarum]|uniref:G5 domain-containing protein n=1 Tax=Lactiplantibacillus plantarum TaxID=1590 RepID=UPI00385469DA